LASLFVHFGIQIISFLADLHAPATIDLSSSSYVWNSQPVKLEWRKLLVLKEIRKMLMLCKKYVLVWDNNKWVSSLNSPQVAKKRESDVGMKAINQFVCSKTCHLDDFLSFSFFFSCLAETIAFLLLRNYRLCHSRSHSILLVLLMLLPINEWLGVHLLCSFGNRSREESKSDSGRQQQKK
jgi:hypothetical protein